MKYVKTIIRVTICLAAISGLIGCTGIGGAKVKADYSKKVEYEVNMNWQAAYRILKDQTIECFQGGGGWSGTGMVDAQLYSELGEAEIQVNNGNWGTYLYIEVFKKEDGAKIVGYSALITWDRNLDKLKPIYSNGNVTFDFDC